MANEDITVFINTYNQQDTIENSIESVLCQKTHYSFKIIILDDCSTDKTSEICAKYAEKYPDIINYVRQKENTNCLQIHAAYKLISSKYFAFLDGDDYWLRNDKIENALNILENNPDYVGYASNGYYYYQQKKLLKNYLYDILKKFDIDNKISYENYIYTHPASRIYRNIIDFNKEYVNLRKRDVYIFYVFLDKGNFYFDKNATFVYNINSAGMWSKLSKAERFYAINYRTFIINRIMDYRHDKFFTHETNKFLLNFLKLILGKKLAWHIYIKERQIRALSKYPVNKKNKKKIKILKTLKNKYTFKNCNRKKQRLIKSLENTKLNMELRNKILNLKLIEQKKLLKSFDDQKMMEIEKIAQYIKGECK